MMERKNIQFFFLSLIFSLLLFSSIALAVPGDWWGIVSIDSAIAANGTVVSAYVNNTTSVVGNTTVGTFWECKISNCSGFYLIHVNGSSGDKISFKVFGVNVTQMEQDWSSGDHSQLNLTMNKTASGTSCTYAGGCSGGYCVHNYCRSASTYCGDGSCDSGETCTSCSSDCGSCATTTTTLAGGGGGGGGSPSEITPKPISPGESGLFEYNDSTLSIVNVSVTVNKTVTYAKINTVKSITQPPTIAIGAPGIIYQYLTITKTNIDDSEITNVKFTFKVEKSWITANNVDPNTIVVYRYVDSIWVALPTTRIGEDATYYYFEAISPGLSVFAVSGQRITAATTTTIPGQTTTTTTLPGAAPYNWTMFFAGFVILILMAVFYFFFKPKKVK
jgi:PGF-pre-PGF domain-containing protein